LSLRPKSETHVPLNFSFDPFRKIDSLFFPFQLAS
jgi:hypothetical protein